MKRKLKSVLLAMTVCLTMAVCLQLLPVSARAEDSGLSEGSNTRQSTGTLNTPESGSDTPTPLGLTPRGGTECAHEPETRENGETWCRLCEKQIIAEVKDKDGEVRYIILLRDGYLWDVADKIAQDGTAFLRLLADLDGAFERGLTEKVRSEHLTVDLNGHKLVMKKFDLKVGDSALAKMTIQDSSEAGNGILEVNGIEVPWNGELNVTGGTVSVKDHSTALYKEITVRGRMNISGTAKVNCKEIYLTSSDRVTLNYPISLTISGGTLTGGIKVEEGTTLKVSGGTVKRADPAKTGTGDIVWLYGGTVEISGGTLDYVLAGIHSSPQFPASGEISISGGTFGTIAASTGKVDNMPMDGFYYTHKSAADLLADGFAYFDGTSGALTAPVGNPEGTRSSLSNVTVKSHTCQYTETESGMYSCSCGRTSALPPLQYLDENGNIRERTGYYLLDGTALPTLMAGKELWLATDASEPRTFSITDALKYDTHLVLTNGSTLTLTDTLRMTSENELTIHVQPAEGDAEVGKLIFSGAALNLRGDLTILGGNITVNGLDRNSADDMDCYGTYVGGRFLMEDGSLTIHMPSVGAKSVYGLAVEEDLIVNGGSITIDASGAISAGEGEDAISFGIYCREKMIVTGGTVNAGSHDLDSTGGGLYNAYFGGISTYGLQVTGGSVTASCGKVSTGPIEPSRVVQSIGIQVLNDALDPESGSLTISGGTVTVNGNEITVAAGMSGNVIGYGLLVMNKFSMTRGELTINMHSCTNSDAIGFDSGKSIDISGGKVTIGGGSVTSSITEQLWRGNNRGIHCVGTVTVRGGEVDITASDVAVKNDEGCTVCWGESWGIAVDLGTDNEGNEIDGSGALIVSGGTLRIRGGKVTTTITDENVPGMIVSGGILAGQVMISGGTVEAIGQDVPNCTENVAVVNAGISVQGEKGMTVTGGTIIANGGKTTYVGGGEDPADCLGIQVYWGPLYISGGDITAVGGDNGTKLDISAQDLFLSGGTVRGERTGGALRLYADSVVVSGGTLKTYAGYTSGVKVENGVKLTDLLEQGYIFAYATQYSLTPIPLSTVESASKLENPDATVRMIIYITLCDHDDYENGVCLYCGREKVSSSGANPTTGLSSNTAADGSVTTVETRKDGTVIETTTFKDGSTTVVETLPSGTSTTTSRLANGVTSVAVTNKDGNLESNSVTIPASAAANGARVAFPVEVPAASSSANAPKITVSVPDGGAAVEIPVESVTPGTVVVIVHEDGSETVVPASKVTENGIQVTLETNAVIKVVDNAKTFRDVPSTVYFSDAVAWATARGIANGRTAEDFGPHQSCSRANLITFLWRAAGSPVVEVEQEVEHSDVSASSYYAEAVRWGGSLGIVSGYKDGRFGSNNTVTREQMAVILYRFAQATNMTVAQNGADAQAFSDYADVSGYASEAMQWAVNAGILQGRDGKLMPNQPCTRGQIVTMLYRLLGE